MAHRTMTLEDTENLILGLDRAGLITTKPGTTGAWHDALADLPPDAVWDAMRYFNREGVPDGRWALRASDIRKRALMRVDRVPLHLQCPDHPDPRYRASQCPLCRRQIEPSNPKVIEQVKALAAQAAVNSRLREQERLDALQERADAGARRVAEQGERDRQKAAYAARTDDNAHTE